MQPGTRPGDPYTQIRISDEFVLAEVENWRYNYDRKIWFHWNGKIWKEDSGHRIRATVKNFLRDYLVLVPGMVGMGKETVDLTRFIVSLNSSKGVRDILDLAAPDMPLCDSDLDLQDHYLNCQNGTLNLNTHEFRPHSRDDFLSRITNTDYVTDATCPTWKKHIETVLENDQELIDNVQEMLGYALSLGNPDAIFPVFFGGGRNGKTITLESVLHLLGTYAVSVSPTSLMRGGEAVGSDRLNMRGARLITANEPADTSKGRCELDTGFIKAATGDDHISARALYTKGVSFKIQGLVILTPISLPLIHDPSVAIWERIQAIPFQHYFPKEQRDRSILKKLKKEGPGILNWLLVGYDRYMQRGYLEQCKKIEEQTEEYRTAEDYYTPFFDSGVVVIKKSDPDLRISAARLYGLYQIWFEQQYSDKKKPATPNRFGRDMNGRFIKKRDTQGWYYLGIGDSMQKTFT